MVDSEYPSLMCTSRNFFRMKLVPVTVSAELCSELEQLVSLRVVLSNMVFTVDDSRDMLLHFLETFLGRTLPSVKL